MCVDFREHLAKKMGLGHLPAAEKYAAMDIAELATVNSQLMNNIARQCDEDVWKLHEKDEQSVAQRVCIF